VLPSRACTRPLQVSSRLTFSLLENVCRIASGHTGFALYPHNFFGRRNLSNKDIDKASLNILSRIRFADQRSEINSTLTVPEGSSRTTLEVIQRSSSRSRRPWRPSLASSHLGMSYSIVTRAFIRHTRSLDIASHGRPSTSAEGQAPWGPW
jgi:hypothetical protein